jgi:hypothetical protein
VWRKSEEARLVEEEIAALNHPSTLNETIKASKKDDQNKGTRKTSFSYQYRLVQVRTLQWYWRSPIYIRGKVILNLVAGLFLGFTFYKEHNSAQGLQNKMFATFTSIVLSAREQSLSDPRLSG